MRLQLIASACFTVIAFSHPAAAEPEPEPEPEPESAPAPGPIGGRVAVDVAGYQDSRNVSVFTPSVSAVIENATAGWSANGRYLIDVVSAASPDIVATASPRWTEVRHAGGLGGRYLPGTFGAGGGAFVSYTPDYLSIAANAQIIEVLDDKNLTLTQGYGYGHDVIGRVGTSFDVFSRKLDYHSIVLVASRVVNESLVVDVTGDVVIERGDQSKPYRYIPIFTPQQAALIPRGASIESVAALRIQARPLEQLPLERERFAVTGRMSWRLERSTVRAEERLYTDTWGLHASTTDARWLFDVSDRVILWPHLRFHIQGGVDFWKRAYSVPDSANRIHALPAFRTGDLELGPLTNVGVGGGARFAFGAGRDWALTSTADGVWTSYADAIYMKNRFRVLVVTSLEVAF